MSADSEVPRPGCSTAPRRLVLTPAGQSAPRRPLVFSVAGLMLLAVALGGHPALAADPPATPAGQVDFAHKVVPLLRKQCGRCHTGARKQGGFSFNTRGSLLRGGESGPAVVEGKSAESLLLRRITSTDPDLQMPPEGPRLAAAEVETLRTWIDSGLTWDDGFAFEKSAYDPPLKPRRVELPPAVGDRTNPIDRLLDATAQRPAGQLPPAIGTAAFLRRSSVDLVGVPPSPEQLAAALADGSPDLRTRWVDQLLDNRIAYADHWLTFWNDLLRNDYTGTGFITGGRKQITTWLYAALLENKPYDQMVRELISPQPGAEGFIEGIRWRGEVSASQTNEVQFAQSISQAFLGINLKCASCHDSFIDRWKLNEAMGLAAVYATAPLAIHRCDQPTGQVAQPSWLFPELGQIDPQASQPERLKQLAALVTHPDNGRLARTLVNRLWHRMMGRGLVDPVDAMNTPPRHPDLLDWLASDFAEHGYDIHRTLRLIATSQTYQQELATGESAETTLGPIARRLTAEQFVDSVWQLTGAHPARPDAAVQRYNPNAGNATGDLARPLQAKWIWSNAQAAQGAPGGEQLTFRATFELPEAPSRTAAIITCDNEYRLIVNGQPAGQDGNWENLESPDLRPFLKAGTNTIDIVAINGGQGNNPAGLLFEVRMLLPGPKVQTVATNADWKWTASLPNAQGVFATPPADWKPAAELANPGVWQGRFGDSPTQTLREALDPNRPPVRASLVKSDVLMRTLGRPNRDQIVTNRPTQVSTLEAIELANGEILQGWLAEGANRLVRRFEGRPAELITWVFRAAFSRDPLPEERAAAREFLGEQPAGPQVEDLLWSLVMQREFQFVQ